MQIVVQHVPSFRNFTLRRRGKLEGALIDVGRAN